VGGHELDDAPGADEPRPAGDRASGVGAADEKSKWEFEVEPYGWAPGNFGSVTVKGRTAHLAVTLSDLYGLLEDGNAFAAAGYFSVSYDRFSVFADSMGGYAEESVTETIRPSSAPCRSGRETR